MINVEGNFREDNDTAWLLDEARPYFYFFCFILFFFKFYFLAFCYMVFGLCLIWEDYDDFADEMDYVYDPERRSWSFYEQFGFLVVWDVLIDYLETITKEPNVCNKDLVILTDFFSNIDNFLLEKSNLEFSSNTLLMDLKYDLNHNLNLLVSSTSGNEILDPNIKKEYLSKYIKLEKNITNMQFELYNSKNLNQRRKLKKKLNKLKKIRLSLSNNISKYKADEGLHNVVIVGFYLNNGLYPITEYDYDVIFSHGRTILYDEYLLFNYDYLINDKLYDDFIALEGLDDILITLYKSL